MKTPRSISPARLAPSRFIPLAALACLLPAVAWSQTELATESAPEAATQSAPPARELSPREIYVKTLDSVAFITTDQKSGTGWVWDVDRRLVVTNDHVVEGAESIEVYFPVHTDGVLQVEPEFYRDEVKPIKGTIIDSDEEHDLAIIQLETMPSTARALTLADRSAAPGERVHAIGGRPRGSEGLWKYSTGFVSQVANADISQTGKEVMALQSNIDINSGNSGGPIVNDEGQVVGVAQSFITDARSVSYSVDVAAIRDYLNQACPLVDSDSAEAKIELGRRHQKRGRLEEAIKAFTDALAKDNRSVEGRAARGWTFLELGDHVTAVADFTAALELNADDVEALRGRAFAYRNLGEYDKSLEDVSRAITKEPTNADLYNARAIIQERREKPELALGDYQRALQLDPENALILGNRADLYMNLERYQDAQTDLRKAIQVVPDNAWLNNMLGMAHYRLRDYAGADPYLAKAAEADTQSVKYVGDWAENAQALGNHQLGIQLWSRALELQAEYPYAYYSRAWSLRRIGSLAEALRDMNRAMELAGQESPAFYYYERAVIHQGLGNASEAEADMAVARQMDPDQYGAADANPNGEPNNNAPFVGSWYVNQTYNGVKLEMSHQYGADGTYQGVAHLTANGDAQTTEEQGTYVVHDDHIRFKTNVGEYDQRFKMEDGQFWLFFEDLNLWIGSVRR